MTYFPNDLSATNNLSDVSNTAVSRVNLNYAGKFYSTMDSQFGAVGDGRRWSGFINAVTSSTTVSAGMRILNAKYTIISGQTTLTITSGGVNFQIYAGSGNPHLGSDLILIPGAGPGGSNLVATIETMTPWNTITISTPASTTVNGSTYQNLVFGPAVFTSAMWGKA